MKLIKILYAAVFASLFFTNFNYPQNFKNSTLINLPGNNKNFNLLQESSFFSSKANYIAWINEKDSVYSVMLRKIQQDNSNIVIASDRKIKSNPRIAYDNTGKVIRIAWQVYENNCWKIVTCDYSEALSHLTYVVLDTVQNDPQITLSRSRIAYIKNGNLIVKKLFDGINETITLDSLNCSSPVLSVFDDSTSSVILYCKGTRIKEMSYWQYSGGYWQVDFNSPDTLCRNPRFGYVGGGICFEVYKDSAWQIAYGSLYSPFNYSGNKKCVLRNPGFFIYPIPTLHSAKNAKTPFFIVYDSDSLKDNKEIFISSFYYELSKVKMNISNSEGDDEKPEPMLITINDTTYVTIIWEHTENGKTDIWMGKDLFDPIWNDVNDNAISGINFKLQQNYPNPFNPVTNIKYSVPNECRVLLTVYNSLGQKVKELVNGVKAAGEYEAVFNAENLSSGIYFYQLQAGVYTETRKFILQK